MNIFFSDGAQKFMGVQKLLKGNDASASLRHPQMAPDRMFFCAGTVRLRRRA